MWSLGWDKLGQPLKELYTREVMEVSSERAVNFLI
jgi:hypothetical protein